MDVGELINELIEYYDKLKIEIGKSGKIIKHNLLLPELKVKHTRDGDVYEGVEIVAYDGDNVVYDSKDVMTIPTVDALFLLKWTNAYIWIGYSDTSKNRSNSVWVKIIRGE